MCIILVLCIVGCLSSVFVLELTPFGLPLHGQFHRRESECHAMHASRVHLCGAWFVLLVPARSLMRRERRIILLIQCHKTIQVVQHGTHMRRLALATLRKMERTCIYKLLRVGEKKNFCVSRYLLPYVSQEGQGTMRFLRGVLSASNIA